MILSHYNMDHLLYLINNIILMTLENLIIQQKILIKNKNLTKLSLILIAKSEHINYLLILLKNLLNI